MINSTEFYQLTYQQQADILLKAATFIQTRREDNFVVDLYELDAFLVEIYYQHDSEDLVSVMAYSTSEKLRTLTNGMSLKPRLTFRNETQNLQTAAEYYA